MKTSIIDHYYDMIRGDKSYLENYLKVYGTEVKLMTPRKNRQTEDYKVAYGATTFANNATMYDTTITHLIIADMDWGKLENGGDDQTMIISPERLAEGALIQFEHLGRTRTLEVSEMLENVQDYVYRCGLRLSSIGAKNGK